jgi:hypothetical protein
MFGSSLALDVGQRPRTWDRRQTFAAWRFVLVVGLQVKSIKLEVSILAQVDSYDDTKINSIN